MSDSVGIFLLVGLSGLILGLTSSYFLLLRKQYEAERYQDQDEQSYVLLAIGHIIDGDIREAFNALKQLAERRNAKPEVYFALAACLNQMGEIKRCLHVYRSILARPNLSRKSSIRARIGLANSLIELGKAEEAEEVLNTLPRRLPPGTDLISIRQKVARLRGHWQRALSTSAALDKAAAKSGTIGAETLARVADEAAAKGALEAASKGYRLALRQNPKCVRAQLGMANLHLIRKKPAKVRRYLMAALRDRPSLAPLIIPRIRATLTIDVGDEDARYHELLKTLGRIAGLELWTGLEQAERLFQNNKLDECRSLLDKLLIDFPSSVELHEAYATLLIELQDTKAVERHLEGLVDLAAELIPRFECQRCLYKSPKPFLECPRCVRMGTMGYTAG